MTADNIFLGEVFIKKIQRARKGIPRIEVTFKLDESSILSITAVDKKTGATAECTISDTHKSLSKEQIARMVEEAEKNKASDDNVAQKIELKAQLQDIERKIHNECDDSAKSTAQEILSAIEAAASIPEFDIDVLQKKRQVLVDLLNTRKI